MDAIDRLPVRGGYETTSRHFNHATSARSDDQQDEFIVTTIDECYACLIQLRNDVCFSPGEFLTIGGK